MSHYDKKERHTLAVYGSFFLLFVTGIVISGYVSYRNFEQQFRDQAGRQLSSIAELKTNELVDWRRGRMADAEMLYQNHAFATLVRAYFEDPNNVLAEEQIQDWLKNYQENSEYDHVRLLDAKGQTHLSYPIRLPALSPVVAERVPEVLQSKQMILFDFYRRDNDQQIRLSLLVPILDSHTDDQVVGLVAISIDPEIYLYPFIEEWPVDSATAETLLIRREGNEALFLNQLRFDPDAALTLRYPLTDPDRPSVKAILGQDGVVEGLDYHGNPVLADIRPVPESPWFLVSKMDTSEVYAPLNERFWQILSLVGMAIFVAGAGLMTAWRQQRIQFYRAQAAAADALRESEDKYRALIKNMQVGVVVHGPDTGVLFSNPMASQLLGLTPDQMQGKVAIDPAWTFIREDGTRCPLEEYPVNRALASDLPVSNLVLGILRPDCEDPIWVLCDAHQDRDMNGDIHQVVVTFFDITERKQAGEALRESEDKFKYIFDNSVIGKSITLPSGEINVNKAFCEMLGYSREELISRKWQEISHPDDVELTQKIVKSLISGERESARFTKRYIHKNGSVVWTDVGTALRRDKDGKPLYFMTAVSDITDRKHVEDALHASELRFRSASENLIDIIYEWDLQDRIDWFGDIDRMMGFPNGEFPRTMSGWADMLHPNDRSAVVEAVDAQLKHAIPYVVEYRIRKLDDSWRWWSARGAVLRDEHGQPTRWIGSITDVTDRKRADQQLAEYAGHLEEVVNERTHELRDTQEKLVRQERLATLGQLAGSMGHELRNPLGVISNAIYFLKMAQPDASDQIKEYLNIIENEARASGKIVTDLLDFTRIKSIEREAVSVSKIISQTLDRFPAPASIEVTLDIPSDLPLIFADPHHAIQILGNLTVNAYQSMNSNGGRIEISAASHNDMVSIAVHDNGAGILAENIKKLFEPLFTTKTKGIGLGLAVSQKLAEANGGSIEVESEAGVGSTFTVWLPVK